MLYDADTLYTNVVDGDAVAIQRDMACVLRNFNRTNRDVASSLTRLKQFFLDVTNTTLPPGCQGMLGIMTTSTAFDVDPREALSPSPDDTRMAFVLGKPVAVKQTEDAWEMGLEMRYVIGIRVQSEKITLMKIYPVPIHKTARLATGLPENEFVTMEARRVTRDRTCTQRLCETTTKTLQRARAYTKEQIAEVIARTNAVYDGLMLALEENLGTMTVTYETPVLLKRAHSIPSPERCATMEVDTVASSLASRLGKRPDIFEPPPVPLRQPGRRDPQHAPLD